MNYDGGGAGGAKQDVGVPDTVSTALDTALVGPDAALPIDTTSTKDAGIPDAPVELDMPIQIDTSDGPATTGDVASGGASDGGGTSPGSVVVLGLSDIWLAGQPSRTVLSAGWSRDDVAPVNSPISVPVVAGSTLSILATGGTSNAPEPCAGATPDGCGIADLSGYVHGPANALSSLVVPANALVGVFVGAAVPIGTAPTGLVMLAPNAFATLSPLLQQTFFIGDGLTGTGSGAVQQFVVPAGATRLFLGSSDAEGANFNNYGRFMVTVSTFAAGGA